MSGATCPIFILQKLPRNVRKAQATLRPGPKPSLCKIAHSPARSSARKNVSVVRLDRPPIGRGKKYSACILVNSPPSSEPSSHILLHTGGRGACVCFDALADWPPFLRILRPRHRSLREGPSVNQRTPAGAGASNSPAIGSRPISAWGRGLPARDTEMVVLYPLEFHRRPERLRKARLRAAARSQDVPAPAIRGNDCCPNCCLPAARPLASKYLPGRVIEHHWLCQFCDFSWTSRFHPLLV